MDRKILMGSRSGVWAAGLLAAACGALLAQTRPDVPELVPASLPAKTLPAPPAVNVAVVNWSIFFADASRKEWNNHDAYENSLPAFINEGRRRHEKPPAAGGAMGGAVPPGLGTPPAAIPTSVETALPDDSKNFAPIGMIRMTRDGAVNSDVSVDVQISYKNCRILATWPPAELRTASLLWRDVHFAAPKETVRTMPEGSWLGEARQGAGPTIAVGSVAESFLLYDMEVPAPTSLQLASDHDTYKITRGLTPVIRDLTFYKPGPAGSWRSAVIASSAGPGLSPASPASSAPSTTAPAVSVPIPAAPPARIAATAPATSTAPAPSPDDIVLGPAVAGEENVLAPWRKILSDAGVSAEDQDLILKILARRALDPKRLTAVYRMAPEDYDKLLPLEIIPQPKKISRIALVIVTNIDPAAGEEVEEWIKQLANSSWDKREAAMAELRKLGPTAKTGLEKALKSKDVEVVYRAEQLLQIIAAQAAVADAEVDNSGAQSQP